MNTLMSNDVLRHDLALLASGAIVLRREYVFAARVLEKKIQEFHEQFRRMDAAIAVINSCPGEHVHDLDLDEEIEDLKAAAYVQFTDGKIYETLVVKFEVAAKRAKQLLP